MKPGLFAAVVVAVFLLGFAVGRTSVSASGPAPFTAAPATPAMPLASSAPSGPSMAEPGQPVAARSVTGVISEVIQVPNYTYLHITTSGGEEWAAVNSTSSVQKGQSVTITQASLMTDFTSNTLKRTFASIWFGQLQGGEAPSPVAPSAPGVSGQMPSTSAAAGALAAIQKAGGPLGLRVADVFAERKALAGKTVRVKGLVTKVSLVQGLNYVHVKDGSGGVGGAADDDLTVVTQAAVKVDDVVTLEGRVAVDKDLGMGSRPVVVEDAKIVGN